MTDRPPPAAPPTWNIASSELAPIAVRISGMWYVAQSDHPKWLPSAVVSEVSPSLGEPHKRHRWYDWEDANGFSTGFALCRCGATGERTDL